MVVAWSISTLQTSFPLTNASSLVPDESVNVLLSSLTMKLPFADVTCMPG